MSDDDRDEDREAILKRRRRFVAMALAGLSAVATTNCDNPFSPCLEAPPMAPVPCLEPMPCLDVPAPDDLDGGEEQPSGPQLPDPAQPVACLEVPPPPEGQEET